MVRTLRAHGITVAHFLPPNSPLRHPYLNLRNHRKLMVADGMIGFCGGLNIRDGCVLGLQMDDAIQDLHFRIRGPVVGQVMKALAFDWIFTTREALAGPDWFPLLEPASAVLARGIDDVTDQEYELLLTTYLGSL